MLVSTNLWACRSLRFTPHGISLSSTVPMLNSLSVSTFFHRCKFKQQSWPFKPPLIIARLPVVACLLFYFLLIICFLFFLCVQWINLRWGIAACGTPSALCWSPITELGQGHYPSHTDVWTMLPLQYRHEAPSRHGAICRDPSSGGLSGWWVLTEPCWLFPAQFRLPKPCVLCYFFVLSVHLNINAPYVKHIECLRWLQCCTWP